MQWYRLLNVGKVEPQASQDVAGCVVFRFRSISAGANEGEGQGRDIAVNEIVYAKY